MNHRKHFVVIFVIFTVFIVLALSCASSKDVTPPPPPPNFEVIYEYESDVPAVLVTVIPNWDSIGGIDSFTCKFVNNSDEIVKVVWEGSSLYYNGNSHVPFIDGQKFVEANRPMAAAVIPRGGFLEKSVYSSGQVAYYSGWRTFTIKDNPVQIIFQIDSKNGSEYVVVNVSYSEATNPS